MHLRVTNLSLGFKPKFHFSFVEICCLTSHLQMDVYFCRYALGGFDGSAMVPSVEIYDPRLGSWMPGEPMNHCRGYSAAAVVKDAIYVIGGVKDGDSIAETVSLHVAHAFQFPSYGQDFFG